MDSLHVADAVLVGHSMGGAIAAEAAIAWPDRVRGLVLIGSSGLGGREPLLFRVARWPVVGPPLLAYGRALRATLREFQFDGLGGGRLNRIAAPTLVVWGDEDRWIPTSVGRLMAGQIPRSAFVMARHAGHAVQEEAPADVNHLLIRFLKQGVTRVPENLALGF